MKNNQKSGKQNESNKQNSGSQKRKNHKTKKVI